MPKMKYFQEIASIRKHYESALRELNDPKLRLSTALTYGVSAEDIPKIKDFIYALKYLQSCQYGFSMLDEDIHQPEYAQFKAAFSHFKPFAQEQFSSDYLNRLPADQKKQLKYIFKRELEVCDYYIEKLKDPVYLKKLPVTIKAI